MTGVKYDEITIVKEELQQNFELPANDMSGLQEICSGQMNQGDLKLKDGPGLASCPTRVEQVKIMHGTDDKIYSCDHCSYQTKWKGNLRKHINPMHRMDAEIYSCDHCSYQTKQKGHFRRHINIMHRTDAEIYSCDH